MKCIRLIIHQNQANYKKYETINNKMTYPLPPLSTIIGAIHSACKWDCYHDMELSIAGNYEALNQRIYNDNIFFNSIRTDRGTLVKVQNPLAFSGGHIKIAQAKHQGASFEQGKHIDVYDRNLLNKWIDLRNQKKSLGDDKKNKLTQLKSERSDLNNKIKNNENAESKYSEFKNRLDEIKQLEKNIEKEYKEKMNEIETQLDLYKTLNRSIKRYEILTNINLIVYIKASEEDMDEIVDNIYNMKSIGRSEDFVEILSCEIVDLGNTNKTIHCNTIYNTYIDVNLIKNKQVFSIERTAENANELSYATAYNINKDYVIENNERKFNKKKVVYISSIYINENSRDVFIDNVNGDNIAVNFL